MKITSSFVIIGIIFLFLINLSSALTYPQSQDLDIKVPFEVNGSIPSPNAKCNLSVQYPNGSYIISHANMTSIGNGEFNYTLSADQTKTLGSYLWVAKCCDSTECAYGYDNFEITPSGFEDINLGQGITIGISIFFIILLSVLFIFISFRAEKIGTRIVLFGIGGVLIVIVILFSLVVLEQTVGGYTKIIEGYSNFWMVMRILVSMSILGLLLFGGYVSFKFWQWKRGFID